MALFSYILKTGTAFLERLWSTGRWKTTCTKRSQSPGMSSVSRNQLNTAAEAILVTFSGRVAEDSDLMTFNKNFVNDVYPK